jgi:hypothetical protein
VPLNNFVQPYELGSPNSTELLPVRSRDGL